MRNPLTGILEPWTCLSSHEIVNVSSGYMGGGVIIFFEAVKLTLEADSLSEIWGAGQGTGSAWASPAPPGLSSIQHGGQAHKCVLKDWMIVRGNFFFQTFNLWRRDGEQKINWASWSYLWCFPWTHSGICNMSDYSQWMWRGNITEKLKI